MVARFKCPACGFAIFNRRLPRCERCQASLPDSMLFSEHDIERINREAVENEKKRREIAKELEQIEKNSAFGRRSGG